MKPVQPEQFLLIFCQCVAPGPGHGNLPAIHLKEGILTKKRMIIFSVLLIVLMAFLSPVPPAAAGEREPALWTNKWIIAPGEHFSLSWDESQADGQIGLWRWSPNGSKYEHLVSVAKQSDGYDLTLDEAGTWYFILTGTYGGTARQSNEIEITVRKSGGKKPYAPGAPMLYGNRVSVNPREYVALSWDEERADGDHLALWKMKSGGDYEFVATVPKKSTGYRVRVDSVGTWYYCLIGYYDGQSRQSNSFCVLSGASDEDVALRLMEEKGMNNTWNLLFIVCERADIGSFHKSFSRREMDEIRYYSQEIKRTLEGITDGWMRVGTVDYVEIHEPITTVSVNKEGPYRRLSYGPSGDLNFDRLLKDTDYTQIIIYAPLTSLEGTEAWWGLGGMEYWYQGEQYMTLQVNAVDLQRSRAELNGVSYPKELGMLIHEIFHSVERFSDQNGWSGYALQDVEWQKHGYRQDEEDYTFKHDLATNQLRDGSRGYSRISYYVKHHK